MNNLEQFIIESLTISNWFIYLVAILVPLALLAAISEIFKLNKRSKEKPKINFLFNAACIVFPLMSVLIVYYIKPQHKTLESLNRNYDIIVSEAADEILLKYTLKEDNFFLIDNQTLSLKKEKINNQEKYYAKIRDKETETTLEEIKYTIEKSKKKKTKEKLTLKDLGESNE